MKNQNIRTNYHEVKIKNGEWCYFSLAPYNDISVKGYAEAEMKDRIKCAAICKQRNDQKKKVKYIPVYH